MRTLLLASAAMLCLSGGAFAQNSNSPLSSKASHIAGGRAYSSTAPRLPTPSADDPDGLLMAAQSALSRGRTGEAQEALERAETRLLDRSTLATDASNPISGPRIDAIRQALSSLGSGDRAGAKAAITTAMNTPAGGGGMVPAAASMPPPLKPTGAPPAGGPSVAPAGAVPPVNPAGQTGGTGNQAAP